METALIDGYLLHLPLRTMKKKAKRIFEIDLLRGLLIIMMVVDHLAYDFGQLAPSFFLVSDAPQALRDLIEWCNNYWYEAWRINFRYAVIALFFILSGLSTYLSVSYTHLRAHETVLDIVCRLLLEKKKKTKHISTPYNISKTEPSIYTLSTLNN